MEELRKNWRRKGLVEQHYPNNIKKSLEDVFDFSDVNFGNIKKGQGDIVIINCKVKPELKEYINLSEYLGYTRFIDHIEEKGIFTNVYFSKKFFQEVTKQII